MLAKLFLIHLVAILAIVLSEEVENENTGPQNSGVVFPGLEQSDKENANYENHENPAPRESKGLQYLTIPNNFQSKSANPVGDNYENDEYDEGIVAGADGDESDYDYRNIGRSEAIEPPAKGRQNTNNRRKSVNNSENTKKSIDDNPRIYTLRDGINIFRNFWRNRTPIKEKEVLPVITLTTSPTSATAPTVQPGQSDEFGTVTGTATGTGTITAASADEIAQNNAVVAEPETPSPFFSFSRRQPIRYEIVEEDSDYNTNQNNIVDFNSDYIDITGDELQPADVGKTSITMQQNPNEQLKQLPRRKNTKQPIKVLSDTEMGIEKPKVVQEQPSKTGLEYYRQYLPNLRKLIEIRPKFFVNRMFPGLKSETNENGVGRNFPRRSIPQRRHDKINKRVQNPVPNIVGIVNTDQATKSNRLPVKRVQLYLI